jgi:hypothetical protein
MSIDAVIGAVERNADGTATLVLMPREACDRHHGPQRMTVVNPPPLLEAAVGTEVWGGGESLMVGRETKWADRIGYTRCRLVDAGKGAK